MASSAQDGQRRPARLARHNSSFLGTIKTIVTAPLTWFVSHDDDDATPTKRRRSSPISSPATIDDDPAPQSKRIRLNSPPRPYLDPPAAAFRRSSVVPRASSAVLPSTRATLSPRRHRPIVRTMSIDPPRRDPSFNFGTGTDTDMLVDKDISTPPSPRPSFRLRASLTPQPQQQPVRYISEPPALNTLISNPLFLHPPPTQHHHDPSPAPTLGSLVESVRGTRSPTRHQHSSLLFSSNASNVSNENKDAPAERALHQLDVYKTPLLPTRMRSSNLPASIVASTTPDMFKSRRSSNLILMSDDKDRLGRRGAGSGKSPVVNETKPYAGEGGMKKLLARRKLEQEEENEKEIDSPEDTPRARKVSPPVESAPIRNGPTSLQSDWLSTAASTAPASGSSLRVGRAKTSRNHIQRPSRAKFSAVYEEEDDVMEEDESRQKERQILEEAAKKVPVFQMPVGFSFAKDAPVANVDVDSNDAKEPPIASLPFSFSKPASQPQPPPTVKQSTPLEVPSAPARIPTPELKAAPGPAPVDAPPSGGSIPNFFANSSMVKKTPLPVPPILNFGTSVTPPLAPSFDSTPPTSSQPLKDIENPFWDGEKKTAESKPAQSLFGGFGRSTPTEPVTAAPVSIFGAATSAFPSLPKPPAEPASLTPLSLPFSFGNTSRETTFAPASGDTKSSEAPKLPFSFGPSAEVKKPEPEPAAPKPLFAASRTTTQVIEDVLKSSPSPFGEPSKADNLFGAAAPPRPTPSPLPFTFGAPPTSTSSAAPATATTSSQPSFFGGATSNTSAAVEAPKPLFGGSSAFSFGPPPATEKKEEAKPAPAPFSFGAAPSTPPAAPVAPLKSTASPLFSFGQPATVAPAPAATAAPIAFSFSSGSGAADVSNKSHFMFGQSATSAPIDRPVTPPKTNDQEFMMEESPTRELQQNKTSSNLSGAFSFGGTGGALFGDQSSTSPLPTSAPFSFGTSSNPFGPKDTTTPVSEPPKTFGGFGQGSSNVVPTISTTFSSFGSTKSPADPQRPATTGSFSFVGTPTSATSATPAFSFGAPAATNPFGQPSSGSAPSSPSTFSQPSPFAFGAPAAASSTPFAFGSQPSSPAGGVGLTLPQPSGGFGSGGGFGQPQQPSSPFSGPIALAPSTSGGGGGGGSLFTIGAAPAQSAGGPRQIKKLPNRRGGAKR